MEKVVKVKVAGEEYEYRLSSWHGYLRLEDRGFGGKRQQAEVLFSPRQWEAVSQAMEQAFQDRQSRMVKVSLPSGSWRCRVEVIPGMIRLWVFGWDDLPFQKTQLLIFTKKEWEAVKRAVEEMSTSIPRHNPGRESIPLVRELTELASRGVPVLF